MTAAAQKRLAVIGALAAIGIVVAANAHLVTAALYSQPACVAVDGAATPAKRAC